MTSPEETGRGRRSPVVLHVAHRDDAARLALLEDDPGTDPVMCLVPLDVEVDASTQATWLRLSRARFVLVLRHATLWPEPPNSSVDEPAAAPGVLAAVSSVSRWVAAQPSPGLRLMCLEPTDVDGPAGELGGPSGPGMHGLQIRGNVDVHATEEGVTMTIAPDDPFTTPDPDVQPPDVEPTEPTVQPLQPDDPDDVPEVPLEPTPAPDETGIR